MIPLLIVAIIAYGVYKCWVKPAVTPLLDIKNEDLTKLSGEDTSVEDMNYEGVEEKYFD